MKPLIKKIIFSLTIILYSITAANAQLKESDSLTFAKVEIEASFPGGIQAWTNYLIEIISAESGKFKKADYGTCIIKFIVDVDGKVSDVEATTMRKSRLAKIAVKSIKNGPNWNPAMQDGRRVRAYRLQPITVTDPDKKK